MNWKARITGNNYDLEKLPQVSKDKDLSIVQEDEHFYLKSEYLDVSSDPIKVNKKVDEFLNSVNVYVRVKLESREEIKCIDIYQLDENGPPAQIYVGTKMGCYAGCNISDNSLAEGEESNPIIILMRLEQKDKSVKKACEQIRRDFNSWDAFSKLIEILEEDHFTSLRRKSKGVQEGKYRSKANEITKIANSYPDLLLDARHSTGEPKENSGNITLSEAKNWILIFLCEWIKEKKHLINNS